MTGCSAFCQSISSQVSSFSSKGRSGPQLDSFLLTGTGEASGEDKVKELVAAVHGVAKSRTQLSNFTFTFHFHALEEEMATHSSVLAWRIPGTGEPAELPSMGSHRVGHN